MRAFPFRYVLFWILALVAVFGRGWEGSFHYDDFHSLVLNPHVRSLANVGSFFMDPSLFSVDPDKAMYRPFLLVTYAFNFAIGDYSPRGYLFVNWLIHVGCALLVWALARRMDASQTGALWAGGLFSVHPLVTEPVFYVSSRSESLAVLFMLMSFYLFLNRGTGRFFLPLSLGAYVLGLLTKSIAAVFPAVLLCYAMLWRRERIPWRVHAPYWILGMVYGAVIVANRFVGSSLAKAPRGLLEQVLTQCKALAYYGYLYMFPTRLNVEHQFGAAHGVDVTVGSAIILCGSGLIILLKNRLRRSTFFFFWGGLSLLPTFLVPLNVLVNEHRLYMLVAVLALAYGVYWDRWRPELRRVLAAWLCVAALLSFYRGSVWQDEVSLWSDALEKSPQMTRPHVFLGNAWRERGNLERARTLYDKALALDPSHRSARTNLANLYLEAAREDSTRRGVLLVEAEKHYSLVLAADPNYREALTSLGSVYILQEQWDLAERVLAQAVDQHPNYADAFFNLGLVRVKTGAVESGIDLFLQALEREDSADIWLEIAAAYVQLDRLLMAADAYRHAAALDSRTGSILYNLAEVLLVAGERRGAAAGAEAGLVLWLEAEETLEHLLRLEPGHQRGLLRLGQLRERRP